MKHNNYVSRCQKFDEAFIILDYCFFHHMVHIIYTSIPSLSTLRDARLSDHVSFSSMIDLTEELPRLPLFSPVDWF